MCCNSSGKVRNVGICVTIGKILYKNEENSSLIRDFEKLTSQIRVLVGRNIIANKVDENAVVGTKFESIHPCVFYLRIYKCRLYFEL